MAEVTISGQKKLGTISKEFQKKFNYLYLIFLTVNQQEKAEKGGTVKMIPFDKTLASVRTVTPDKLTDISIHGKTKVSTLERTFREEYGLNLQVAYKKDDKNAYYTSGDLDELTLTQLNKRIEEKGYQKNPKIV